MLFLRRLPRALLLSRRAPPARAWSGASHDWSLELVPPHPEASSSAPPAPAQVPVVLDAAAAESSPGLSLSPEQLRAVDIAAGEGGAGAAARGRNLLLTGPGGTGKSAVIREIKRRLEAAGKRVGITATTGAAAVAVGGTTLHSFLRLRPPSSGSGGGGAGASGSGAVLGLGAATGEAAVRRARFSAHGSLYDHLRSLSCLVVDEVSMMRPDLLYQCDAVLRSARHCPHLPFGGLQVVFAGDFFQLPPIIDDDYRRGVAARHASIYGADAIPPPSPFAPRRGALSPAAAAAAAVPHFVFETRLFYRLVHAVVDLSVSFRHTDARFAHLLSRVRRGHQALTAEDRALLLSRADAPLPAGDGIKPTLMYSTNVRVSQENQRELDLLGPSPAAGGTVGGTAGAASAAVAFETVGAVIVDAKLRRLFEARKALARRCKALGVDSTAVEAHLAATALNEGEGEGAMASVPAPVAKPQLRASSATSKAAAASAAAEAAALAPHWTGATQLGPQLAVVREAEARVPRVVRARAKDDADARRKLREALAKRMASAVASLTGETASASAASAPASTAVSALRAAESASLEAAPSTYPAPLPVPRALQLRVGAQVMLTANLDVERGLVNGSRGVVEGFRALHPSSSSPLPASVVTVDGVMPPLPASAPPVVRGRFGRSSARAVTSAASARAAGGPGELLPYVKFAHPTQRGTHIYRTVERAVQEFDEEGGLGRVTLSQVPLRLAWAATIHKSQGMSLDRVRLSLRRIFDHGQAYVALSRARTLEGMSIEGGLRVESISADPRVLAFYAACGGADGGSGAQAGFSALRADMLRVLPLDADEAAGRFVSN